MPEFAPIDLDDPQISKTELGCAGCGAAGICSGSMSDHLKFTNDQSPTLPLNTYEEFLKSQGDQAGEFVRPESRRFLNVLAPEMSAATGEADLSDIEDEEIPLPTFIEQPKTEFPTSSLPEKLSSPFRDLLKAVETIKPVSTAVEATPSHTERVMDIPVETTKSPVEMAVGIPTYNEVSSAETLEELEDLEQLPAFDRDPNKINEVVVIKSELKESHVETYSATLGFKLNNEGQMDLYFESSDLGVLESWDQEKVSGPGELSLEHMQGIVSQLMESGHALAVVTTPDGKEFTYLYELEGSGVKVREFIEKKPEPIQREARKNPEKPKQPNDPDRQPIFGKLPTEEHRIWAAHEPSVNSEPLNVSTESFRRENTISRITNGIYIEETGMAAHDSAIESPFVQSIDKNIEKAVDVSIATLKAEAVSEVPGIFSAVLQEKPDSLTQEDTLEHPVRGVMGIGGKQNIQEYPTLKNTSAVPVEEAKTSDIFSESILSSVADSFQPTNETSSAFEALGASNEDIGIHIVSDSEQEHSAEHPISQTVETPEVSAFSTPEKFVKENPESIVTANMVSLERAREQVPEKVISPFSNETTADIKENITYHTDTPVETQHTNSEFKTVRVEDFVAPVVKPVASKEVLGQHDSRGVELQFDRRSKEVTFESANQVLSALRAFKNLENIPRRESKAPNSLPPVSLNDQLLGAVVKETPGYLDGAEIEALAA